MKFRELLPFLPSRAPPLEMKGGVYASCLRSSVIYGSETRPLLVDVITTVIRSDRLRWYGHVMRKGDEDWVQKCMEFRS